MNINGSKNLATVYKELMRARPDPSSLSEGAGLQTKKQAACRDGAHWFTEHKQAACRMSSRKPV